MSQKQVPRPGLKRLVDQRTSGMESEAANIPSAGFRLCILRMHLYRLALTPSSRTLETIITNIDVVGKGNQKRLCQDQTLSLPHLHCRQSANRLWLLAVCHWAGTWGVPAESQLAQVTCTGLWLAHVSSDGFGISAYTSALLRYVLYCCRCLMTATACLCTEKFTVCIGVLFPCVGLYCWSKDHTFWQHVYEFRCYMALVLVRFTFTLVCLKLFSLDVPSR